MTKNVIPPPPSRFNFDYPDSDGQPMADNTLQFQWIVLLKENLDRLFADNPEVFVAGDLLWYPVEGQSKIRGAPDVMVIFGRPKGYRGSYIQHQEEGIAPQVVFEILSPSNTMQEFENKRVFYETYGVEEYYLYNPYDLELMGWLRQKNRLQPIEQIANWQSPRLKIIFDVKLGKELTVRTPSGEAFRSFDESENQRQAEKMRADLAEQRQQMAEEQLQIAEQGRKLAEEQLQQRVQQERNAKIQAIANLRNLGLSNEQIAMSLGFSFEEIEEVEK